MGKGNVVPERAGEREIAEMSEERAKFEAWAGPLGHDLGRWQSGMYRAFGTRRLYEGWVAARRQAFAQVELAGS